MIGEEQKSVPIEQAYAFGRSKGLDSEINAIIQMKPKWDKIESNNTLRRGYIVHLFENRGIWQEFKDLLWPFGNTAEGEHRREHYLRRRKHYLRFINDDDVDQIDDDDEEEEEEVAGQFGKEAHLREFLAKNPQCIEPGLTIFQSNGQSGVEYPIAGGRIDILAVDRDNNLVVIELKVSKGRNKVIGQLLYYMGWVDKNLDKGPCRGMIIANEIADDLVTAVQAVQRVPGITLARYNLNVAIEMVDPPQKLP
jgi:hypothetical protein